MDKPKSRSSQLLLCLYAVLVCVLVCVCAANCKPAEIKHVKKTLPSGKWIDEFGQNQLCSWPGKVLNKQDLLQNAKLEQDQIAKMPVLQDRDEYQAWANGPTKKSTGFFRIENCSGKWWLVAPNGHLFYSIGIDCVVPGAFAPINDKTRGAYSWIPPVNGEYADAFLKNAVSFHIINMIRKFGSAWKEEASNSAIVRSKAWGFTCLGNWSDEQIQKKHFPYVSVGPETSALNVTYISGDIADVYEHNFEEEVFLVAQKLQKNKDDRELIGYFLDNEMPWWNIPQLALALDGTHACKKHCLEFLRRKYVNIEALNKSWGTRLSSFESQSYPYEPLNKAAQADLSELRSDFAERYYDCWYRAIKSADPNHLVLGSRIPYAMDEVVLACARHTDVLSFNHYDTEIDASFERYYKLTGKPILIGEYDFDSLDAGLTAAWIPVKNQKERGAGYSFYTENAAAKPFIVGTHYFQYLDEPLTGRFDGESSFNGFVDVTDHSYYELVSQARKTNASIYHLHNGTAKPTTIRPQLL